ncbi:MAG: subtilisin family serine protease [Polaribacter sp.]|jgi:subtilisin family serine protease
MAPLNVAAIIDLFAPGSSITSTWNNGGTNTISGTSMASPHVAGLSALYSDVSLVGGLHSC